MKSLMNSIFLVPLLCVLHPFVASAEDPGPRGTRVVTLGCTYAVSVKSGGMYYGGPNPSVRITRNNIFTRDEMSTIKGVPSQVVELIELSMAGDATVKPAKPGPSRHLDLTADGVKIFTFDQNNCMNSPISAIVLEGDAIMNCTFIKSDVTTGVDAHFCQPEEK